MAGRNFIRINAAHTVSPRKAIPHSTWLFDTDRMRFRRVLKGLHLDNHPASTGWRPYFGLDIDPVSESFVVLLNPEGTRLLRSWRHVEHCTQCGGEATGELRSTSCAAPPAPEQLGGARRRKIRNSSGGFPQYLALTDRCSTRPATLRSRSR